jgi:peroxiredoxin
MNEPENISRGADSPSVGLLIGAKAPAFAARDQFGHEQTNETLKGANGTVLLFFRSADW